ncbi:aminotransferase class IV [Nocardioides sp.]|uniref:aminotransferase class IV n=1 Tax=Nocardioides sp. TaxID=35761 RepID=UPI002620BFCA|nr:aminotransferase class IV [Nocardioides sp.]
MSETTADAAPKYGCFTTVRVEALPCGDGIGVRGWGLHVERLQRDTRALYGSSVAVSAMATALHRGVAESGLALPHLVRLAVESASLQAEVTSRGLTPSAHPLRVAALRHDRMRPTMKHTATAPEFALRDTAIAAGYDDAVMLTADGTLTEGTTWSLVLGRPDGTWVTPAGPVLPSVTVALVGARVPIEHRIVTASDLEGFTAAAALGSGRGVHPIASIGSVAFAGRVDVLREAYAAVPPEPVALP